MNNFAEGQDGDDGILMRQLTDETYCDARKLVADRFPAGAFAQLDKVRSNPLLREEPVSGFIAYENGVPACFQASVPRAVYWGSRRFLCVTGGMTCVRKDASPIAVLKVMEAARDRSAERKIYFGNTMCRATSRMNKLLGVKGRGPGSMEGLRFAVVHPLRLARYMVARKLLKRSVRYNFAETLPFKTFEDKTCLGLLKRDADFSGHGYDEFWNRYIKSNHGVVCSRTEEELEWAFGERVRRGKCVVLSLRRDELVQGFIVLESWGAGIGIARWRVLDLIALHNDLKLVALLLRGAKKFLFRFTPAMSVELMGFPTFAQKTLRKCLPYIQKLPNNFFSFSTVDRLFEQELDSERSWFFGPYDGDMCM